MLNNLVEEDFCYLGKVHFKTNKLRQRVQDENRKGISCLWKTCKHLEKQEHKSASKDQVS